MEAAEGVREAAEAQGYTERSVIHVEPGFEWGQILAEASAMSLFAERRVLDVRMSSPKPGREGSKVLRDYAANPPQDTVLLLQMGRLEKGAVNSAWVKALDKVGVVCQVWDLGAQDTLRWVEQRLRRAGFIPDSDAVKLLSERIEGNLLAAAQEIDKLKLLLEPGPLDFDSVQSAVVDSSRFDIFELADAALAGNAARAARILGVVKSEGVHAAQVAWVLSRDIRLLTYLADAAAKGATTQPILKGLWQARIQQLTQASRRYSPAQWTRLLQRSDELDDVIKGRRKGNEWDDLLQLTLGLAGKHILDRP